MNLAQLSAELDLIEALQDGIQAREVLPAQAARYASPDLDEDLQRVLKRLGVERLYIHQAEALQAALRGEDFLILTGTGSGKSLAYNLPVFRALLAEPMARALYLFPTKALGQDQLGSLVKSAGELGIRAAVYDGDTPSGQRRTIRKNAQIILTNPDMLHMGILPRHEEWGHFLRSLRVVVVDEMHTYRGVFGSHVSNVLQRLWRLCRWAGSRPSLYGASATLFGAEEFARKLTGREPRLITEDGGARGQKLVALASADPEAKVQSANELTARVLASLVRQGIRTMAFCRSRIGTELVLRSTREHLGSLATSVDSYRGGYAADERREIEQRLFRGDLVGLVTTNAMELGVDVGHLNAVILNGFPGTIASFWQQVGRAGRAGEDALAILIAREDPLEQYFLRNPDLLLRSNVEAAVHNPSNPYVLRSHLVCAAYERPIGDDELARWGSAAVANAETLAESRELERQGERMYYPSFEPPAGRVNIRGTGADAITILAGSTPLGTQERWRATRDLFPGAIYLHRGETYRVLKLDLQQRVAWVQPTEDPEYTSSMVQSVLEPLETLREGPVADLEAVKVTTMVTGYQRFDARSHQVIGFHELDFPPETLATVGVHFRVDVELEHDFEEQAAAIHGLEHALMSVAPLLCGCDRNDLGSAWYGVFPATMKGAVVVYDSVEGGIGLAEHLFGRIPEWLAEAEKLIRDCPCHDGCPKCLLSTRCEIKNAHLTKTGCLDLLQGLAAGLSS